MYRDSDQAFSGEKHAASTVVKQRFGQGCGSAV